MKKKLVRFKDNTELKTELECINHMLCHKSEIEELNRQIACLQQVSHLYYIFQVIILFLYI